MQIQTRLMLGDLAGVEEHFGTGLKFFDDPGLKQFPAAAFAFGHASLNAWMLGRADTARERQVQMMAAASGNHPYGLAFSGYFAATLRVNLGEYDEAEALAGQTLELSQKHQLPFQAALSRIVLGQARAQLGRAAEGVGLIRQGVARLLEIGSRIRIRSFTASLGWAQYCEGAIGDALATVEQALQANPAELVYRPETLRIRGEIRLKLGRTELAEADFREAIALAQKMGAKSWELRTTVSPRAAARIERPPRGSA
jgi:tetratricopeptide (TPR) repeat protein